MKIFLSLAIAFLAFTSVFAQHEYAPVEEHAIKYKDWTYKNVRGGGETNLRDFAKDKKLVMVVYFAQWCPNWKLAAPVAQRLYDKYNSAGFAVIGVSEYDTVEKTKANLEDLKVTFPVVWESDSSGAKQKTPHYEYRKKTGDKRNWGSPWNIFLTPADLNAKGDMLTEKAFVVNGELVETEVEAFIRKRLGLTNEEKKIAFAEIDKANKPKTAALKKP